MSHVQDALAASGVGLWSWSVHEDSVQWSAATSALFGRASSDSPDSLEQYLAWIHPDDRDDVASAIAGALEAGTEMGTPGSFRIEHRVALPAGGIRWLECRGSVTIDGEGNAIRMDGTTLDCTERRRVQAELVKREEVARLQTDLIAGYLYVVEVGAALIPEILGGSFERITGFTTTEVLAMGGWTEIMHPHDRESAGLVLESVLRGEPSVAQYRIVDADGRVRWLRDHIRPVCDPTTGQVVRMYGSVIEVSELIGLEAQLVDARRHEALARFSGGVAHDFNNLLTVIAASVDLMDEHSLSPVNRESVEAIRSSVDKASHLTRGMLLFARRSSGSPRVLPVGELVDDTIPMLRRALGIDLELQVSLPEEVIWVRIDPAQLQLLLLNLAMNARHAMPNGGRVELVIELRTLPEQASDRPPELVPGPYVAIEMRDHGVGIDPEILPRIFEPYFTTRGQGEGTGLGLSACQGIAGQAGGAMLVASRLGEGASFTVLLPPARGGAAATASRSKLVHASGGTERLLLVEDEPILRQLFTRALAERGYAITSCADAETAVDRLEVGPFDMVVTDVVMPGMGGLALAELVSERFGDTAILLISGNVDGAQHAHPFLAKPLTPSGLARRVRELLDARKAWRLDK